MHTHIHIYTYKHNYTHTHIQDVPITFTKRILRSCDLNWTRWGTNNVKIIMHFAYIEHIAIQQNIDTFLSMMRAI